MRCPLAPSVGRARTRLPLVQTRADLGDDIPWCSPPTITNRPLGGLLPLHHVSYTGGPPGPHRSGYRLGRGEGGRAKSPLARRRRVTPGASRDDPHPLTLDNPAACRLSVRASLPAPPP